MLQEKFSDFVGQAQTSSNKRLPSLEAHQQHRGTPEGTPICTDAMRKLSQDCCWCVGAWQA